MSITKPATAGILLKVMAIALVLLGAFLMFSGTEEVGPEGANGKKVGWFTPWDITINKDGTSGVFGIVIGRTIVNSAMRTLNMEPEISVFKSRAGGFTVEAYFGRVRVAGLTGTLIANLEAGDAWLAEAEKTAVKRENAQNGAIKIILSSVSYRSAMLMTITALTYIPSVNLDADMVRGRFGEPVEKITLNDNSEQWLYPDKGLLVAINKKGKEIFEYVRPADFDKIAQQLARELR